MNGPMLARSKLAAADPGDEHTHHPRSHGRRCKPQVRAADGPYWRRWLRRREDRFWRKETDDA